MFAGQSRRTRSMLCQLILTCRTGFIAPLFLIEFPEKARFLTDRQKHIATSRLLLEKQDKEVVHPTAKQSLAMLVDWKILLFGLQYFVQASSVYSLAFCTLPPQSRSPIFTTLLTSTTQSNPSFSSPASASATPKPNSCNHHPTSSPSS